MRLEFKFIRPGAILPKRNPGDAGMDLFSNFQVSENEDWDFPALEYYDGEFINVPIEEDEKGKYIIIRPLQTFKLATGLVANLGKVFYTSLIPSNPSPEGFVPDYASSTHVPVMLGLQTRSKSGLALKSKLVVTNSPGTIDTSYSGELSVILTNIGDDEIIIRENTKIAQAVAEVVLGVTPMQCEEVSNPFDRGVAGFGSTGLGE